MTITFTSLVKRVISLKTSCIKMSNRSYSQKLCNSCFKYTTYSHQPTCFWQSQNPAGFLSARCNFSCDAQSTYLVYVFFCFSEKLHLALKCERVDIFKDYWSWVVKTTTRCSKLLVRTLKRPVQVMKFSAALPGIELVNTFGISTLS